VTTTRDWGSVLDALYANPDDTAGREWAQAEIRAGRGTPGQQRALEILTEGHDVLALLVDGPRRAARLLAEHPASHDVSPARGAWTARQLVHHLADNESVNAVRLRAVLTEPEPDVYGYDSDDWLRFYEVDDIDTALERWRLSRQNLVGVVSSLDADELNRRGVLSYRGAESVRVLVTVLAGHDRDHLEQLERTLRVVGQEP
jgi:hypothetical protein